MNQASLQEIERKLERVRNYLEENRQDAMVLGRKDNFAWFTCGGANEVVVPTEAGCAVLLITQREVRLIAQVMDGQRILDEELCGLDVQYVPLRWYEPTPQEKAAELVEGTRAVSDIPIAGARCSPREIASLHYPLTDVEIERTRRLGKLTEGIIRSVADEVQPGMTEQEIAGMLLGEYGRVGAKCDVLLVGSDERISRYRHPCPSEKKIERYVLLHPAVQKWGLHANVTRSVHFGPAPDEIGRRYQAACRVAAAAISMCRPGERFSRILEAQKRVYAETGFAEEWRGHFQGGVTGYLLADPTLCLDPEATVSPNQAYDWFITITGVKVEELALSTARESEICSVGGQWPAQTFEHGDQVFALPQILVR
jgi:Xaa-Pro aminopeptidase